MLQGTVYTAPSVSEVDLVYLNVGTFLDAIQFGLPTDTWTLSGMILEMQVKASRDDATPLLTISSALGTIVFDDVINRVIHFNVPQASMQAALAVGKYVYDLVMIDQNSPPIRTPLMQGHLYVQQGVTET